VPDFFPSGSGDRFFFLVGVFTVPGTAKPLNSQLQRSHNRLYLKKTFEKMDVGRYPRRMRLLRHLGHFWDIIR
jgi:hypothetical protein